MQNALLEMRGIAKLFPGVQALEGVDFILRRGEIHALMGENGAGKSTLIKTLTGVHPRDGGTIRLDGRAIDPRSPQHAEALGISTVYQEVNLIPYLSVAENICLGREPTFLGAIRWGAVKRRAAAALARVDLRLDVTQQLNACSMAVQQMVAIARALDVQARLLILDEPTSSLDAREVEELFAVMRKLRGQGLGIVFVTHFLEQVYAVTDRITVLRDGKLVGEYETATLPRMELVSRMIGKEVREEGEPQRTQRAQSREEQELAKSQAHQNVSSASSVPSVSSVVNTSSPAFVVASGLGRRGAIAPVDLSIDKGEVVGLAGLLGSGRTELARLLFGIDRADSGAVALDGRRTRLHSPRDAIRHGFAFTSENRKVEGIIPHLSVRENIILALQGRTGTWAALPRRRQLEIADQFIRALGIKTPSPEQPVGLLSGGNQQKVLLARWLALHPRLLILDEPTRGIDVGAKAEIEKLIAGLREQGMAILFISSELEEVVRACQKVVVLRDRAKVGELAGSAIDEQAIMRTIARHVDES